MTNVPLAGHTKDRKLPNIHTPNGRHARILSEVCLPLGVWICLQVGLGLENYEGIFDAHQYKQCALDLNS